MEWVSALSVTSSRTLGRTRPSAEDGHQWGRDLQLRAEVWWGCITGTPLAVVARLARTPRTTRFVRHFFA